LNEGIFPAIEFAGILERSQIMYTQGTFVPVHLQGDLFNGAAPAVTSAMLDELKEQLKRERAAAAEKAQAAKQPLKPKTIKVRRRVVTLSLRNELRHSILHTLTLVRRVMNLAEIADACECSEHRAESLLEELAKGGLVRLALAPNGYEAVRKPSALLH
jgi:redox-regulated HSP33 family molecular chaperone